MLSVALLACLALSCAEIANVTLHFPVSGSRTIVSGVREHWSGAAGSVPLAPPRPVRSFRGLKYATAQRFQAPSLYEYTENSISAVEFGAACWQRFSEALQAPLSEDCLHLNIYSPERTNEDAAGSAWPVVVYIHGGAFAVGAGSSRHVNGPMWAAEHRVVFVSLNYRLGLFGFYRNAALTAEQPSAPANHGLLDQRAALLWIQQHIASFGGDPQRVTVMGESAGASSILHHLTTIPPTHRLFARAIVQNPVIMEAEELLSLEASYPITAAWNSGAGCDFPEPSAALECMRKVPPSSLLRPAFRWSPMQNRWMATELMFPVQDQVNFPAISTAVSSGKFDTKCHLWIGSAANESTLFAFLAYPLVGPSLSLFDQFIKRSFQDSHAEILAQYHPDHYDGSSWRALSDLVNDVRFQCPLHDLLHSLGAHTEASVHRYVFDYVSTHARRVLGAAHAQETAYVMQLPTAVSAFPVAFEPLEWALARHMSSLWAQFAHGKPVTAAWTVASPSFVLFGRRNTTDSDEVVGNYKSDICGFWKRHPTAWNSTRTIVADLSDAESLHGWIANESFWVFMRYRALVINSLNVSLILIVLVFILRLIRRGKNPFAFDTLLPKLKKE